MIWWLIGVFWVGLLCGIFAMCIFIAGNKPYADRAMEENERPLGHPSKISVTSDA
jgi:hypothetical protein